MAGVGPGRGGWEARGEPDGGARAGAGARRAARRTPPIPGPEVGNPRAVPGTPGPGVPAPWGSLPSRSQAAPHLQQPDQSPRPPEPRWWSAALPRMGRGSPVHARTPCHAALGLVTRLPAVRTPKMAAAGTGHRATDASDCLLTRCYRP